MTTGDRVTITRERMVELETSARRLQLRIQKLEDDKRKLARALVRSGCADIVRAQLIKDRES